jgi:outer membrane protein OmpA-like peptidoglycan-associated protein
LTNALKYPMRKALIGGVSDSVGDGASDVDLSDRRAVSVRSALRAGGVSMPTG